MAVLSPALERSEAEERPPAPSVTAESVTETPKKQPPPESKESIRLRQLVILSFWAIVIFLGVPIWLWTTSTHRARLPLQEMLDWAEGRACRPAFPLRIIVEGPQLPQNEVIRILRATQHALDDQNDFSLHHLRLCVGDSSNPSNFSHQRRAGKHSDLTDRSSGDVVKAKEKALTITLMPNGGLTSPRAKLQPQSASLDIQYPPSSVPPASSTSFPLATFIAGQLQDLFSEEQALIALALTAIPASTGGHEPANSVAQSQGRAPSPSPELAGRLASRNTRALRYAPTYHIAVSLFSPTAWPSSWDIESAVAEYLAPLLESASVISNFTVDTQIQLHARFSPSVQPPEFDADRGVWTLRQEDLGGFVNAAEWPLSPSIGAGPTLNFIIYVPDPSTSPLIIKESQATSWLIPQWGGIVILNSPVFTGLVETQAKGLSKEQLRPGLLVFSHQLLSFLGAPESPLSIPLKLQTLTRVRAVSLLLSASSTMGSLARLTVALPSIAIPETVSTAVDVTLQHLGRSCNALKDGKFTVALDHAKTAESAAERGFFEKSMVGQVYFPDEHKVAVYLPLLGPVGVPLIMSALKELRRAWTARRSQSPTS
ncbi:MAG: hypothetical protein L6R39_004619 [Caloplaca ligustica]|nr:MAG: hypothetical protein L6R39_004619 [Caloplaca ligustica]